MHFLFDKSNKFLPTQKVIYIINYLSSTPMQLEQSTKIKITELFDIINQLLINQRSHFIIKIINKIIISNNLI